jgi:hypothetical protein
MRESARLTLDRVIAFLLYAHADGDIYIQPKESLYETLSDRKIMGKLKCNQVVMQKLLQTPYFETLVTRKALNADDNSASKDEGQDGLLSLHCVFSFHFIVFFFLLRCVFPFASFYSPCTLHFILLSCSLLSLHRIFPFLSLILLSFHFITFSFLFMFLTGTKLVSTLFASLLFTKVISPIY